MQLFNNAGKIIAHNPGATFGFVAGSVALNSLYRVVDGHLTANPSDMEGFFRFGLIIFLSVSGAVLYPVFMARYGNALDPILWRCRGVKQAVGSFFLPWLIINLLSMTVHSFHLQAVLSGNGDASAAMELLSMLFNMVAVPAGACIMFSGRFEWRSLSGALAPMARNLAPAMLVFMLCLFQWYLLLLRASALDESGAGALLIAGVTDIPFCLLDCMAFVMMWQVCQIDRERQQQGDFDEDDF